MANPYTTTGRRISVCFAAAMLLTSVGCGWTDGRYASDPMLGNFNRPIAATPPIYTGGDPGVSPAYDTGVRLGLTSPDVPPKSSDEHTFIMPTYQGGLGMGGLFRGNGRGSSGTSAPAGGGASFSRPGPIAHLGARLPSLENRSENSATFVAGMVTPLPENTMPTGRPRDVHAVLSNGSSIAADLPKPKTDPVREALRNPERVASVEEAHTLLTSCGAKTQTLEQSPTGEWRFICTMGDGSDFRRYEAKHREPIEAVRAVLVQVNSEK